MAWFVAVALGIDSRFVERDGRLESEAWYGRLDEEARQGYRQLGRDVMLMLRRHLEDPGATEPAAEVADVDRRAELFVNEVLIALVEAYTEEKRRWS